MDEFLMRRFLGLQGFGGIDVWLAVAYLVCMFGVLAFRSGQISSPYLFRVSYILFGIALILPSFVDAFVQMSFLDGGEAPYGRKDNLGLMLVSPVFYMLGRVLFAVSVVCALASLRKGNGETVRPRAENIIPPADQ